MGGDVTVEFVAKDATSSEWKMVLVEAGPWNGPLDEHLRTLQSRLYDYIDVAIEGKLAERFPEATGKRVVIQVDCYNIPRSSVEPFFNEFSSRVFSIGDYKDAVEKTRYVSSIEFVITFDSIH